MATKYSLTPYDMYQGKVRMTFQISTDITQCAFSLYYVKMNGALKEVIPQWGYIGTNSNYSQVYNTWFLVDRDEAKNFYLKIWESGASAPKTISYTYDMTTVTFNAGNTVIYGDEPYISVATSTSTQFVFKPNSKITGTIQYSSSTYSIGTIDASDTKKITVSKTSPYGIAYYEIIINKYVNGKIYDFLKQKYILYADNRIPVISGVSGTMTNESTVKLQFKSNWCGYAQIKRDGKLIAKLDIPYALCPMSYDDENVEAGNHVYEITCVRTPRDPIYVIPATLSNSTTISVNTNMPYIKFEDVSYVLDTNGKYSLSVWARSHLDTGFRAVFDWKLTVTSVTNNKKWIRTKTTSAVNMSGEESLISELFPDIYEIECTAKWTNDGNTYDVFSENVTVMLPSSARMEIVNEEGQIIDKPMTMYVYKNGSWKPLIAHIYNESEEKWKI